MRLLASIGSGGAEVAAIVALLVPTEATRFTASADLSGMTVTAMSLITTLSPRRAGGWERAALQVIGSMAVIAVLTAAWYFLAPH